MPVDCPNCGCSLRPTTTPSADAQQPPALPNRNAKGWNTPVWLESGNRGYSRVFTDDRQERFHDETEGGEQSTVAPPTAEAVVGQRDDKGKSPVVPMGQNQQ